MALITLTQDNFKEVIESNHLVIIEFWATWCKPCLSFSKTIEHVSRQHADLTFGMVDIDVNEEIVNFFNVTQVPCLISIKDQVIIDGVVGEMPLNVLEKTILELRQFNNSEINQHFANKISANQ